MSKYTPGPWAINTAGSAKAGQPFKVTEIYVYAPDTQDDVAICADVIDPVTQAPSEANARLIAAAPDMASALRAILFQLTQGEKVFDRDDCITQARNAYAKATGGAA